MEALLQSSENHIPEEKPRGEKVGDWRKTREHGWVSPIRLSGWMVQGLMGSESEDASLNLVKNPLPV